MLEQDKPSFDSLWGDLESAVFEENWEAAEDIIEKAGKLGYRFEEMQQYINVHKSEEVDGF